MSTPYKTRAVEYIGAPFCEGQNLAGADLAPQALRDAGLARALKALGWAVHDAGDLDFETHFRAKGVGRGVDASKRRDTIETYEEWRASGKTSNFAEWAHAQEVLRVDGVAEAEQQATKALAPATRPREVINAELMGCGLELVHGAVARAAAAGRFALTIGGDHSVAAGSVSALCGVYPKLSVIWVDAHADANTPATSPSLHYHGMPAAHLLGWFDRSPAGFDWLRGGCLAEQSLAYIGLRDVDEEEARLLRESKVHVFTMRDVDKHGIGRVVEMALQAIDPHGCVPLHLSLDIDAVDPMAAPGTGTTARGGLSYREIHYICEEMAMTKRLVGMDLVEVNPELDRQQHGRPQAAMHGDNPHLNVGDVTPTVHLATDLVLSALGKTIMHDKVFP